MGGGDITSPWLLAVLAHPPECRPPTGRVTSRGRPWTEPPAENVARALPGFMVQERRLLHACAGTAGASPELLSDGFPPASNNQVAALTHQIGLGDRPATRKPADVGLWGGASLSLNRPAQTVYSVRVRDFLGYETRWRDLYGRGMLGGLGCRSMKLCREPWIAVTW
jgi:hypothetical protein